MPQNILLAPKAGFCMGVSLALKKLDKAILDNPNCKIYTLGPIIHNPQVLKQYEQKGVKIGDDKTHFQPGDIVLIRAHGIPFGLEQNLKQKQIKIIDATCPKVKKAQLLIQEQSKKRVLLLYGEKNHPEVKGLLSYAQNQIILFESLQELLNLQLNSNLEYVLAAQTTQDQNEFYQIQDYLKRQNISFIALNTICNATEERQKEAIKLAQKVDFMIVVGGKISGNTRRLAKVVSQYAPSLHIETSLELDLNELSKYSTIGITAGASTPQEIIDEVILKLKK